MLLHLWELAALDLIRLAAGVVAKTEQLVIAHKVERQKLVDERQVIVNPPHLENLLAAQAKLFGSETAMYCANEAIQIHGGYGFVKDFNVERYYRDAKITEIYEGTSEIQKIVISSHVLKE